MTFFYRIKYAFAMTVIVTLALTVVAILFSLDIGATVYSNYVFIPVFAISYIFVPVIDRYIKYK